MKTLLSFLVLIAAGLYLWFRLSPDDPDRWHVDPADDDDSRRGEVRLIGLDAPRFPGDADKVLQTFSDIALSEPRVRVLDGSVEEGMLTFVARSRAMGFRDYITAKAVGEGANSKLAILSRPRIDGTDFGQNAARLDRWLQEMEHALGW